MEAINQFTYSFNPGEPRLTIFEGDRVRGGFTGNAAIKQLGKILGTGVKITISDMENEARRRNKVRRLRAIWVSQGIDNQRAGILEGYGVTSTAELTVEQLDELIKNYSAEFQKPATDEERKLRSRILVMLTKMGKYTNPDDWAQVNQFLMQKRIAGKLLYQMSVDEMKALIRKLHAISGKTTDAHNDELRKAMMN